MSTQEARLLHDLLLKLENRLLQPEVRRSSEELKQLLAEEFVEFGSSGVVYNRQQIIAELKNALAMKASISKFGVSSLSPEIALAMYRATITVGDIAKSSLRSSIWCRRTGEWQMVFHQGTPTRD